EFHHDRQPEPRARLRLIEAQAPLADARPLIFIKAGTVVGDGYGQAPAARAAGRRRHLDGERNVVTRPLAGIVEEVAEHFLEILPLTLEARIRRAFDVDDD